MEYIMKYKVHLKYGGSEEGGWWFDVGVPQWKNGIPFPNNKFFGFAWRITRWLNDKEYERRKREEKYEYTSVLAYKSTHYSYEWSDTFKGHTYPSERPHYE